MTALDIPALRNALKSHLASGGISAGVSWPGVGLPAGSPKPYLDVSFSGVETINRALEGGAIKEETGQFNAVIVTESGRGEDEALGIAQALAVLFHKGREIEFATGQIAITDAPRIAGGYPTDADYRVPFSVRYHALTT